MTVSPAIQVRCTKAFDYLTKGEVYNVDLAEVDAPYLNRAGSSSGTSLRGWQYREALQSGKLVLLTK